MEFGGLGKSILARRKTQPSNLRAVAVLLPGRVALADGHIPPQPPGNPEPHRTRPTGSHKTAVAHRTAKRRQAPSREAWGRVEGVKYPRTQVPYLFFLHFRPRNRLGPQGIGCGRPFGAMGEGLRTQAAGTSALDRYFRRAWAGDVSLSFSCVWCGSRAVRWVFSEGLVFGGQATDVLYIMRVASRPAGSRRMCIFAFLSVGRTVINPSITLRSHPARSLPHCDVSTEQSAADLCLGCLPALPHKIEPCLYAVIDIYATLRHSTDGI